MASRVGSYIGNLGKSISYATIDVVKDNAKNTAGFIETNADLFKEIYAGVKDYNKTFTRISANVRDSKVYKAANEYKTSLFEDIKSGKFYNKDEDRENRLNNAASGGLLDGFDNDIDMGDFDLGDDWGDSDNDQEVSRTVSAIERTTKASVEANSMAIARTGEYIVANNRAANNILFNQNARALEMMGEGFNSVGKEINLIRQVVSGPMTAHAENSKKYFETSLGFFEKMTNTLTEMNERQKKQFETMSSVNDSKTKKIGYGDVVDAGGMPDLKEYMKVIGKNTKKMMGPTGDMLLGDTFGEGSNMLMAFVASPLSFIPKYFVNALIPNIVKNTAKELDGTFSTLFGNMVARFNKMSKGDNPILKKIGELFGISTQSKNSLDTSKYKKDAIPFDGITKKAITEVIPGYLRNIEKSLSGKAGNVYDYENGKWTNERDVAKEWKRINEDEPRNDAFSDVIPYLKKSLEKVRPETKSDYDTLQNDMGKLLDYIYSNDGVIKFNNKNEMKKVQSGISVSDASMAVLTKVLQKAPRQLMYGLAPGVLEAKNTKSKKLTAIEETGISPLIQMHNNSIDKSQALSDRVPAYTNILVSTKDDKGNNLFFYLQSILGAVAKGNGNADLPTKDKFGKPIKYAKRDISTGNPDIDKLLNVVPDNRPNNEKKTDKKREEDRYKSATQRAKDKGQKVFYDPYGDNENISKVNAEIEMEAQYKKFDKMREDSVNGDWFAKLEVHEDKYNKDGKKLSLMDKLLTADSLTAKFKVMQDSIQNIVKMPTNFLVATMESADKRLYQLLFGYDSDEKDKNGKPIKGFLGHMLNESSKAFDHFNKYIDENILAPLKKKLGIENFGDLFDKIATSLGFDEKRRDGIRGKVKDFFKPFGDSIKKAFTEALEATKKATMDTYAPIIDEVAGDFNERRWEKNDTAEDAARVLEGKGYIPGGIEVRKKLEAQAKADREFVKNMGITVSADDKRESEIAKRLRESAEQSNRYNELQERLANKYIERNKRRFEKGKPEEYNDQFVGPHAKIENSTLYGNDEKGRSVEQYINNMMNRIGKMPQQPTEDSVDTNAKGAKYVTKSGITVISKGEMIVPANLNPLNPDRNRVDIKKQGKDEELIKGNYINELTKRLKLNIGKNRDGTFSADPKAPLEDSEGVRNPLEAGTKDLNSSSAKVAEGAKRFIGTGSKAVNEVKDGASYLYKRLIGDPKKDDKALSNAMGEIGRNLKEYAPDAVGYGLLGGAASLLTGLVGGPLLGAAAGAAIGIVKKSKGLQDILFGKVDEETDERTGGVVGADFQKKFKQYFPNMKQFGLAGAVTGLLTPFGPIGGLMIGSAIGFAKSNAGIQKFLFGELNEETNEKEGGLINAKTQKLIKSATPKMLAGAVGTLLLGPFGVVGNAALGAGLGLVASTDKFKDIMFGKADENGEREGGVVGAIRTGVIDPIKDALVGFKESFLDFMQDNVMNPLKDFISPMGQQIKNMIDGIGRSVSGYFTNRFEKSIGIPLDQLIKEKFIQPMTKFFSGVFKATLAPVKMIVSAPFKALGGIGNHMRRGQIKKGMAGNMTAEERLKFMQDKPGLFGSSYATKNMDLIMKDQDLDTLRQNRDALGAIEGGRGYFERRIGTSKHNMSGEIVTYMRKNKLDTMMTPKQRNQFIRAAQSGDIDFAKEILRTTHKNGAKRMDKEDQENLMSILSKYSNEIDETKEGQKVVDKSKKDILSQLSKNGIDGINSKNIYKYLAMYDTEYKAKKRLGKKNVTADDAQDPVMAKIISEKSNAQITLLERLVSIMEEHYGLKKTNDSVKVEKAIKDKDEITSTVNANGEIINFKKSTDGSTIGATADDNKKIQEGKEAAKTQKGILGALNSFTGKVGDFFKGKKKGDSEEEDEEDDDKKKKSSFISRILKGLFTSKATKVVAAVAGGITGVAVVGHIGKWWDEKGFPSIKNWFERSAFGQRVVGFLGDIATNIGNMFGNITDWFSGKGKFNGAGFPFFWKEGVVPFYTIGISYFLETMLPNLITTAFKTLPHLLMGVVKGIGSILKTPIDQLLGKKAIGKKQEPISIGSAFKQSMSSNMAMNSNVPGGKEYLRNKFGNIGKFTSDNKEVVEKYDPNAKNNSDKSGGVIMNQDGTLSTYSYDDFGNPVFDGPTTDSGTKPGTGTSGKTNESILDKLQETFAGGKKDKPAMFGLDNKETAAEATSGGLLRGILTGNAGLVGTLAHTKYGQGLSRIPIVGKFIDAIKMLGHPIGRAANAVAENGHNGLVNAATRGAGKASMAFGGKAARAAGYNAVSDAFNNALYKNASQEVIDKASREYVEDLVKKQTAKTGVQFSEEFIQKAATNLSKSGQTKIMSGMGIGVMEEVADSAVREGAERVAKGAVKEGVEAGTKKGLLDPVIKWVTEQLAKLFSNKTIVGKVAEGIGRTGSKAAAGATKAAKGVLDKMLTKIVGTFTEHAAKSVAKVTAKFASIIGSAGTISIVFAVADFISGFNNANSILGTTEMPNFGMRLATGLLKAVNGFVTMGIIPEDILVDIFVQFLAPALKIDVAELKKDRDAAIAEIEQWNSTHGEDEQFDSVKEFNDKDKLSTKIKKGFSNAWDGIKDFFGFKKKDKKKKNENVLDKAVDAANSGLKGAGAAVREYGERVSNSGLPIVTEATDPNPQYTPEGIWIQPANTTSGIDYNQLTYTNETNAGGNMGGAGVSPYIANQAMEASGISPTGYNEADVIAAATANIDPAIYKGIVGSLTNLVKTNNMLWNQNLDKTISLVSSGDFITDKDILTNEFKTELKDNIVSGIRYSIGRAWMTAAQLASYKIDMIFGRNERNSKINGIIGTSTSAVAGAAIGGGIGTLLGPLGTVVGVAAGGAIGGLIGKFATNIQKEDSEYARIQQSAIDSVNNISNTMMDVYTDKLNHTVAWLDEIKSDNKFIPPEIKTDLFNIVRDGLKVTMANAWQVAGELAKSKFNKALGLDPAYNFWRGVKEIGLTSGVFQFLFKKINEYTAVDPDVTTVVDDISDGMKDVYTTKLGWTKTWLDDIVISDSFMPPEFRTALEDKVRTDVRDMIGSAWAVSSELAKSKFNKALGLDPAYNFWTGIGEFGTAIAANGTVGIFKLLLDKINEITTVDPVIAASIDQLSTNMIKTYTNNLTNSEKWLQEIVATENFTEDLKPTLVEVTKDNVKGAIANAWQVSGELAKNKFNVALGLDKAHNFWNGIKEIGRSGVFKFLFDKINESTKVDSDVAKVVDDISDSMQKIYTVKLGWSKTWLDEIVISDHFMPPEYKESIFDIVRNDLKTMIGNAWQVAGELARSKFNVALGLDKAHNFWSGIKEIGLTGGVFQFLFDKIAKSTEVDPEIAKVVEGLVGSMEEIYTTKTYWSGTWLDEIAISDHFMPPEFRTGLEDTVRSDLNIMVGNAWQVASELAKNKFNTALGLDKSHNFWTDVKEFGSKAVFKFLSDKITENTETDSEIVATIDDLSSSMGEVYTNKIGWSKTWLDDILNDDTFLSSSKDGVTNTVKNNLRDTLTATWDVASASNMSNWGAILKSMTQGNPALNDIYNDMDIPANPHLNTNDLPEELQETKVNMESIFSATNRMWNKKLVSMLDIVNAGSLGDIDLINRDGEFTYEPIDDGAKDLEESYNGIKIDLKDSNTNMRNYFDHDIKDNSAFSGIQKMMFYTKKLFAVGPLMFNRVTTDLANQFSSYGRDLTSATKYISTVNNATKKEINNLSVNTKFNNIFKDQKFDSPFKKIIHWTNKILSFPLYMAKYMSQQMSNVMSSNDALGVFKTFDDLIKHLKNKGDKEEIPYIGGLGTGKKAELDPSMSSSYHGDSKGVDVYKQIDPSVAGIRFNNPGDSKRQTIKDSGCAPVNAANIINTVAGANVMSVREAANYAIQNGFKEQDGGTDISYFSSILKDNNIPSASLPNNPMQIKKSLAAHHPVVLLGKANGKLGGPFGKSSHFVTATGLDEHGNIIVQNPETSSPYTTYKANDILNNTTNALVVGRSIGMGSKSIPLYGYGTGFGTTVDISKVAGIAATIISQSEGDYGSINANDNGSMSIGKIQWNANSGRALPVLRRIVAMNPSSAKTILGDSLYNEIANGPDTLWTRRSDLRNGRKASASEKPKLSKLLDSKEGRAVQNATIAQDVPAYIDYGIKHGISAPDALIYFADACNQYGTVTAWNKIKAGSGGSYTLDNLHKSICSNGLYISRRNACYNMCKKWQQYPPMDVSGTMSGSIPMDASSLDSNSDGSNKISTIFDYITSVGNEALNKVWGADNVKAIFGDISNIMTSNDSSDRVDISGGAQASPYNGTSINNFPYFNQADPRWASTMYSSDGTKSETMASSACGPTALSMIAKSYGVETDPVKMAQFSMKRGWRIKGAGTSHALMTQGAQELGLQSQAVNDLTAYQKVKEGFPVISSMGPGHFTKGGHFITLVGVNKDGKYLVNDPSSTARSQQPWDESIVSSESRNNWVISKDNEGSIGRAKGLGTGLGSKMKPKTVDLKNIKNILPQSKSELNAAGPIDTVAYKNSRQNSTAMHNATGEATYMKVLGIIVDVLCKIADNTDKLSEVIKILNEKFDLNIKPEKTDNEKSVTKESMKRAITQSMKNSDGLAGSGSNKSSISKDAESIIRSLRMIASQ